MVRLVLCLSLPLAACAPPPEVDVSRFAGRIPAAPDRSPGLAPPPEPIREGRAAPEAPRGRSEALRARAAALSGPVIPPGERARLERGPTRR